MTFGVNPSGFPAPTPGPFPNFIQFRQDGVDLGGPDADTVDFTAGISATRGVGENENVVTVTGIFPLEALGVPFVGVTALNIGTGITAVQDVDGVVTITTEQAPDLSWRTVTGDDAVQAGDIGNGIIVDSAIDAVLSIETGIVTNGRSVLVLQRDDGVVNFVAGSGGPELVFRESAFAASTAGNGAIVTLIGLPDGSVLLCGDLESL